MKLATWNVQGIRNKQSEVFEELKKMKIDICVLTETKKKGKGNEVVGEYVHIYSGVSKDSRAKRGVSIAIHKDLRSKIKSWEEIDEQIIKLEINKNGHNIAVIGTYAPSEDADKLDKDKYYEQLQEVLSEIKKDNEIYLLGDFNGRVGQEENHPVVGMYGEITTNDNGMRLRDVCENMSLRIMNGFFSHKDIHKFTWEQPTRKLKTIIDYIIQRQNSKLKTTDVRVYRGPECGTDHYLVMAKVIVNYRKASAGKGLQEKEQREGRAIQSWKYNLESLRQESVKFLYKLRLANKLQRVSIRTMNAEMMYQQVKTCVQEAANEALGCDEKTNKQPEWFSGKLKKLVEQKKSTYWKWLSTRSDEDREVYMQWNRVVKAEVTKEKNEIWEKKCEELDRYLGGTRVSQAWKTIKNIRTEGKRASSISLISIKQWRDYYERLLNEDRVEFDKNDLNIKKIKKNEERTGVREITVKEIQEALIEIKNGKAAGPGNIPIELVKYGPEVLHEILVKIFNKCMINGEDVPEDWNLAYISSIFKRGSKKMCENYRGISVTSSVGRLYGRILKKRIETEFSDIEEQNGFRAGRSCMDNVFVLQQIIEKRKARSLPTHLVFVDLEKAYDSVPIKKLFESMTKVGISEVYIRSIWNIYRDAKALVKWGNNTSEKFTITKGLKQGCCLSPTLFKIYIKEALDAWRRRTRGMGIEVGETNLTTLLFADDQIIIANDEEDADFMYRKLVEEYQKWGLTMNKKKTEYLVQTSDMPEPDVELQINKEIRKSREYKYLGSIISEEGTSRRDICSRAQQGRKSIRILNSLLWSNRIRLHTKMTIYRAVVEPILTYGAECWQITSRDKRLIEAAEMDYLRRACRVSRMEHIPNEEIRRRTNRTYTAVDRIESRQLIWYGHVMRMSEDRWPKRAINYIPANKRRRRGRPNRSWMQGIREIMADRAIKEEDWQDREVWRSKCGMRQRL